MEDTASGLQILLDVWETIVKLLGRPVVQYQLLAGGIAILVAWLVARPITRALDRRYAARVNRLREEIVAAEEARLAAERQKGDRRDFHDELRVDEELVRWQIRKHLGPAHLLHHVGHQLAFPLLALVLVTAARALFSAQNWYSGLLADLASLLGLFLAYRLSLGLLYAFGNREKVQHLHHRLLAPLLAVTVLLLSLNEVVDLDVLAEAPVFALQEGSLTLGALFLATFGFYFWITIVGLIKDLLQALFGRRQGANPGTTGASLTLVQYGLIALGLFGVFQVLQLSPTTIAAITGGLSIGVGFALQDVLKNFIGGLIVLFEGSVRPGDWVEIAGTEGEVDKLSIRSTIVRTFDNVEYIVPNQDWLASTVVTYTRTSRRVRTRVPIGVSYDADPHFVRALLEETAEQHPDVLHQPPPMAVLVDFGTSSVDFVLLAWVEDAKVKGRVAAELRLLIWDALAANDIEIPYPQQDLHIRSGLPAVS